MTKKLKYKNKPSMYVTMALSIARMKVGVFYIRQDAIVLVFCTQLFALLILQDRGCVGSGRDTGTTGAQPPCQE